MPSMVKFALQQSQQHCGFMGERNRYLWDSVFVVDIRPTRPTLTLVLGCVIRSLYFYRSLSLLPVASLPGTILRPSLRPHLICVVQNEQSPATAAVIIDTCRSLWLLGSLRKQFPSERGWDMDVNIPNNMEPASTMEMLLSLISGIASLAMIFGGVVSIKLLYLVNELNNGALYSY